jgi:hypothetical protein
MSKTVKVRIPVAVDPRGRYVGYGWGGGDLVGPDGHAEALDAFDYDTIGPQEAHYWITAELPIPEVGEVEAEVEVSP